MTINKLFNLEGKTALVTGAGSGIGQEISKTLYNAGANLALAARRKEKLEETQTILSNKSQNVEIFSLDVTEENSIKDCLAEINKKFPSVDILVNNAGMTVVGTLDNNEEDEWNNVINTNLRGPWALSKLWLKSRLEKDQQDGVILNVSSITGEAAQKGNGIYAISKAALTHMTRQMALEWAKYNVRVNAIAPGYFRTDISQCPKTCALSSAPTTLCYSGCFSTSVRGQAANRFRAEQCPTQAKLQVGCADAG